MSNKLKIAAKIIIFAVVFIIISYLLTQILTPKFTTGKYRATTTVANFYEEPKNTLDVLYFGTSAVAHGISPLKVWDEFGIASYSLATEHQPPIMSYYLLKESLRFQEPKVIFLECNEFFIDIDYDNRVHFLRKVLDYMPLSKIKIQAVSEIVRNSENQTFLKHFYPLITYHDRWEYLQKKDFQKVTTKNSLKGVDVCYEIFPCELPADFMQPGENDKIELDETGMSYLERIVQLCKTQNINLVLIAMPRKLWTNSKSEAIYKVANEFDLTFIDYNLVENSSKIGFDSNKDFYDDGGHLNAYGAEKISMSIGAFLMKKFEITDRRNDPNYIKWFNDLEYYKQEKLEFEEMLDISQ